MCGMHILKTWSTTQATVAMSSAEAELYALVKGAAQTLGMLSIGRDLGIPMQATLHTDASAALSIIQRQGVGKMRHVATQFLWIQEKTRRNAFDVAKIPGEDNPADILTKNVPADILQRHLVGMGVQIYSDRASTAPMLSRVSCPGDPQGGPGDEWLEHGTEWITRVHEFPRTELFTPSRVGGAPPGKALTPARITRGKFTDTNESFCRVDSWKQKSSAHRDLGRPWRGATTFIMRST